MALFSRKPEVRSRVIAVVGMHRSGTSCLAGSLQQKGLFLGDVHEWNQHNLRGNRENDRIAELDEAILRHSKGSWFDPPGKLSWTRKHEKERNKIIESFETAEIPVWGFKEPRALLTMPFWRAALPKLEFVGTYRHPYLVAQSLERRDSMPIDYAVNLWLTYNQQMISLYEQRPFPVISFDLSSDEYLKQMNQIAGQLKLPDATNHDTFLDAKLKNTLPDISDELIGADALALYNVLCSLPCAM